MLITVYNNFINYSKLHYFISSLLELSFGNAVLTIKFQCSYQSKIQLTHWEVTLVKLVRNYMGTFFSLQARNNIILYISCNKPFLDRRRSAHFQEIQNVQLKFSIFLIYKILNKSL